MKPGKQLGSVAWQRWTLLITALVLATALAATAWLNNRALTRAASDLVDAEARSLLVAMRSRLFRPGAPPTQEDIKNWIDEVKDRGVLYVRVGIEGQVLEHGNSSSKDVLQPEPPERIRIERHGERVRATSRIPRPRRPRGPRARGPPGRGPRAGGRDGPPIAPQGDLGPPLMSVEFVPVAVNTLLSRALRNLVVNLGVAVVLLILAAIGFRLMRRRESLEARRREETHLLELGETSAVLAHELRNPLASLKGHAQLLKESAVPESRTAVKAERIISEALRLERLTNGLLDFVRAGAIERGQTNPTTEIARAIEDAEANDRDNGSSIETNFENAPETWPSIPTDFAKSSPTWSATRSMLLGPTVLSASISRSRLTAMMSGWCSKSKTVAQASQPKTARRYFGRSTQQRPGALALAWPSQGDSPASTEAACPSRTDRVAVHALWHAFHAK